MTHSPVEHASRQQGHGPHHPHPANHEAISEVGLDERRVLGRVHSTQSSRQNDVTVWPAVRGQPALSDTRGAMGMVYTCSFSCNESISMAGFFSILQHSTWHRCSVVGGGGRFLRQRRARIRAGQPIVSEDVSDLPHAQRSLLLCRWSPLSQPHTPCLPLSTHQEVALNHYVGKKFIFLS